MPDELASVLFSWAVFLSGLAPQPMPPVVKVSHATLEHWSCHGPCAVLGWYDGQRVYLDNRLDDDALWTSSIVVHEFVHVLQHASPDTLATCAESVALERQAYAVQTAFLTSYGVYMPVQSIHTIQCGGEEK